MVKSIGLDLIEVTRIKNNIDRYGEKFVQRILGNEEKLIYRKRFDKALFLAGRFAAKEAVIKGMGYYLTERPALGDVQIINGPAGQPELVLPATVQHKLPTAKCHISITHEKQYAAAVAVFEDGE